MNSSTSSSSARIALRFTVRLVLFGVSLFVVLELFFRFVVIADCRPAYYQDPETRLLFFDPAFQKTGTHRYGNLPTLGGEWIINDAGWASSFEYFDGGERTSDLIALYGDSYVVSMNTDYTHHLDVLIKQSLSDEYDVYSFAMGGMMLMQYVKLIEYAERTYNPKIHIIFVNSSDISTSIVNYGRYSYYYQLSIVDSGYVEEIPPIFTESVLKRYLRHSALVRFVRQNRSITAFGRGRGITDPNANRTDVGASQENTDNESLLRAAASHMFEMIRTSINEDIVIFVGDAPRSYIYDWKPVIPFKECEIIRHLCDSLPGFIYLDLIPVYQNAYCEYPIRFNDDDNAHWNEYGNEVVSSAVVNQIRILEIENKIFSN